MRESYAHVNTTDLRSPGLVQISGNTGHRICISVIRRRLCLLDILEARHLSTRASLAPYYWRNSEFYNSGWENASVHVSRQSAATRAPYRHRQRYLYSAKRWHCNGGDGGLPWRYDVGTKTERTHIRIFGPKNYAYKTHNTETGAETTVCKERGITLNYSASQMMKFERLKQMILRGTETDIVTVHTARKIKRKRCKDDDARIRIVTEPDNKTYRVSFLKRRRLQDNTSVPFGYIKWLWLTDWISRVWGITCSLSTLLRVSLRGPPGAGRRVS